MMGLAVIMFVFGFIIGFGASQVINALGNKPEDKE